MRSFALCVLLATMALSLADCGCGAKCAIYTDPAKCTRCCTATVKRSLSSSSIPRRSHRFLLPQMVGNPIRIPMWLAAAAYSYSPSSSSSNKQPLSVIPRHRRHRRTSRRLLDRILTEAIERNI
ncbi:hypothetical protein V3C99_006166 [Haemonchus contortus]